MKMADTRHRNEKPQTYRALALYRSIVSKIAIVMNVDLPLPITADCL
jgi:hypothetical protein